MAWKVVEAVDPGDAGESAALNPQGYVTDQYIDSGAKVDTDRLQRVPWYLLAQTTGATESDSTADISFARGLKLTKTTNAGRMGAAQIFLKSDMPHLFGRQVMVTGKVRLSVGGTVRVAICSDTGTNTIPVDIVDDWTDGTFQAGNFFIGTDDLFVDATAAVETAAAEAMPFVIQTDAAIDTIQTRLFLMVWSEDSLSTTNTLEITEIKLATALGESFNPQPVEVANILSLVPYQQRELLTANRTYWVDQDGGDDQNDGLSSGTAFASIVRAVEVVNRLNLGGFTATINAAISISPYAGDLEFFATGTVVLSVEENTPPQEIGGIYVGPQTRLELNGAKIPSLVVNGTLVGEIFHIVDNGISAEGVGSRLVLADVTWEGDPLDSLITVEGGQAFVTGDVVLVDTPDFVDAGLFAIGVTGFISWLPASVTGTATGKKYIASSGALIDTADIDLSGTPGLLPGDEDGEVDAASFFLSESIGNNIGVYSPGGTDVAVADGGTGRSSHTAYAVLCGGTTTTAAQQSIASVGTAGQLMVSAGASALPAFNDRIGAGGSIVDNVTVTIASDEITITSTAPIVNITVDTESAAASDNLQDINGVLAGQLVFVTTTNNARDVVIKHNTGSGNLRTLSGGDLTLANVNSFAAFKVRSASSVQEMFSAIV